MGDKRTPLPLEPDKRAETAYSREAGSRPASEAIPKAVANRMARRVAVFTGLPTLASMGVFVGSYVQPSYEITDNFGFTRYNANIKIKPSNDNIQVDALNNIKAVKSGKVTLTFSLDAVETSIDLNIVKNPINKH